MQHILAYTQYLPSLRFLIVDGLTLDPNQPLWPPIIQCPAHILLFNASRSQALNTSAVSSRNIFHSLLFLDLSGITLGADFGWQYSVEAFPYLRVLKLRGMGLTGSALPDMLSYSDNQIWSLDVRDNNLNDRSLNAINRLCCHQNIQPAPASPDEGSSGVEFLDDVPKYTQLPPQDNEDLYNNVVPLRPDDEAGFISILRAKDQAGHLVLAQHNRPVLSDRDDLPRKTGITQLYISGNKITGNAVKQLLADNNRLQVFDAGSVPLSGKSPIPYTTCLWQPSSTPFLQQSTGARMEVLRIHHSIVTYCPSFVSSSGHSRSYTLQHLFKAETEYGASQSTSWEAFMPSQNNRLRELTLTHVPDKSYGLIIEQIKHFLKDAAAQEQALVGVPQHRRAPKALPGLKRLKLELIKSHDPLVKSFRGLSISGDEDSKRFHEESEKDFSFFPDEGNSASSSATAGEQSAGTSSRDTVDDDSSKEANPKSPNPDEEDLTQRQLFDVVEELRRFRATAIPAWSGILSIVQTWH